MVIVAIVQPHRGYRNHEAPWVVCITPHLFFWTSLYSGPQASGSLKLATFQQLGYQKRCLVGSYSGEGYTQDLLSKKYPSG